MSSRSACACASSVPLASAAETSAAASTGASLLPSPTARVTRPSAAAACSWASLSAGDCRAAHSSMPSAPATAATRALASPLAMASVIALRAQRGKRAGRATAQASPPHETAPARRRIGEHQRAGIASSSRLTAGGQRELGAAQPQPAISTMPTTPAPASTRDIAHRRQRGDRNASALGALPGARASRVSARASGCELSCASAAARISTRSACEPAPWLDRRAGELRLGERAGLVEQRIVDAREGLQRRRVGSPARHARPARRTHACGWPAR